MDAALGPVVPAETTGVDTGLGGGMTHVAEKVAQTVGERVMQRCPSVPQLRFVLTNSAFGLRTLCMAWIVAYAGSPSIGGMVGF